VTGADLLPEAVELLKRLVACDTSNPPGRETQASAIVEDVLGAAGVECERVAKDPARTNLVARLPGSGDGPSLAFLCHFDVVQARREDWSVEPFAGIERDGAIWGRGTVDMKCQVAATAVAIATLAREGWRGSGDLVFVAAADEEVGDGFGLQWLVEAHPDAVRTDFCVNEGAGQRLDVGGQSVYLCATAEKTSAPFLLRVHGRSGHASVPSIADNALVKAAPLVARLGAFASPPRLIPEVEGFFAAVDGGVPAAVDALERARRISPVAAEVIEPLLALTASPTKVRASEKRNVIPALCEVTVDVRLLPGQSPAEAEAELRAWLGPGDYDLVNLETDGGTRSPIEGPLWDAVRSFVAEEEPGAVVAPTCCAGFTDSHWVREAFGTVAYGFFPARALDPQVAERLVHSADERVPVADLELGLRFLTHAARAVCG
jgi:acetylornithine deacetylase/succinyl-diaminopimelate desuccinylase-like protein